MHGVESLIETNAKLAAVDFLSLAKAHPTQITAREYESTATALCLAGFIIEAALILSEGLDRFPSDSRLLKAKETWRNEVDALREGWREGARKMEWDAHRHFKWENYPRIPQG